MKDRCVIVCFMTIVRDSIMKGLLWAHTGDFMLEESEETLLQGNIRL